MSLKEVANEQQQHNNLEQIQNQLNQIQTSLQNINNIEQMNELKQFVFKMQNNLQKNNAENLKKIAEEYSEQIKTISQSVVDDTVKAIRRNSETLNEETKKFISSLRAVKKTHFGFLANALLYVFGGAVVAVVVYAGFSFCQLKRESLKELAAQSAVESIEKKAVADYKKEILADQEHQELTKLVESWNKKNGRK